MTTETQQSKNQSTVKTHRKTVKTHAKAVTRTHRERLSNPQQYTPLSFVHEVSEYYQESWFTESDVLQSGSVLSLSICGDVVSFDNDSLEWSVRRDSNGDLPTGTGLTKEAAYADLTKLENERGIKHSDADLSDDDDDYSDESPNDSENSALSDEGDVDDYLTRE